MAHLHLDIMQAPHQQSQSRLLTIAYGFGITLALAFAYHGIHLNGFQFDDWPNILDNRALHLRHLNLEGLLGAAQGAFLALRPVASVTFAVNWWQGGGAPAHFLLTNLALHVLAAWAVFALLARTLAPAAARHTQLLAVCALATLWWAAQPIHIQAVSYIVQRMTELAALFSILTVWAWLKARTTAGRRAPWFALSVIAFALAAGSKENAWITPLLVLMAELLLLRPQGPLLHTTRDRILLALPLLAATAALADLAFNGPLSRWALGGYQMRDFTLAERLLTQPKVVLFHVSQILWPLPSRFSLEHDIALVRSATDAQFWLPLAIITSWCALAAWLATRPAQRLNAFFMLWVPVTLLIESSVVPLELIFEHRMYLPAVGFAALIASALFRNASTRPRIAWALGALVAAHTFFALWATQQRLPHWRTEATLYDNAVRVAPASARAWNHFGIALLNKRRAERVSPERYQQAMQAFSQAIALNSAYPDPWTNRGVAKYVHGDLDGAFFDLRKAISINPRQPAAQHYLGELYSQRGQPDDARIAWKRACALGVQTDCSR